MNRRLSALDDILLVSNSDAHSLDKLGREANVFEMEQPSYVELRRILMERDREKFIETIEFFPEEGKYHADGHRNCSFSCLPSETERLKGLCPTCGKPLTIGVLNRVHALADRGESDPEPTGMVPYRYIIPLIELVASIIGVGPSSKRARAIVEGMLSHGHTEFGILLDEPLEVLNEIAPPEMAAAILSMRKGEVDRTPGYDGEFGVIRVKAPPPPKQSVLKI
jgi:PHP family Zn ribbon phosphoesterase